MDKYFDITNWSWRTHPAFGNSTTWLKRVHHSNRTVFYENIDSIFYGKSKKYSLNKFPRNTSSCWRVLLHPMKVHSRCSWTVTWSWTRGLYHKVCRLTGTRTVGCLSNNPDINMASSCKRHKCRSCLRTLSALTMLATTPARRKNLRKMLRNSDLRSKSMTSHSRA